MVYVQEFFQQREEETYQWWYHCKSSSLSWAKAGWWWTVAPLLVIASTQSPFGAFLSYPQYCIYIKKISPISSHSFFIKFHVWKRVDFQTSSRHSVIWKGSHKKQWHGSWGLLMHRLFPDGKGDVSCRQPCRYSTFVTIMLPFPRSSILSCCSIRILLSLVISKTYFYCM